MMIGCIHGRFQPFHKGHFEYLCGVIPFCDQVLVGITQYDRQTIDDRSPAHRLELTENPFSYWERYEIIQSMIQRNGLDIHKIHIVPFPINDIHKIRDFVPQGTVMFTTIYDRWNVEKIRRLKEAGFDVRVLWRRRHKTYEGRVVRQALLQDTPDFMEMVPVGVAEKIGEFRNRNYSALTA